MSSEKNGGWALNRRELLCSLAAAGALALARRAWAAAAVEQGSLRTVWLGPEGEPAAMGAEMGTTEAQRAAELLGRRFACDRSPGETAVRAGRAAADAGVLALIGGAVEPAARAMLEDLTEERGLLLVWAVGPGGGEEPEGRGDRPRKSVFHISPGPLQRRAALERWRAGQGRSLPASSLTPSVSPAPEPTVADLRVLDWHPDLTALGAAQLNRRFRERFGRPMHQEAWAGWFAVKAVAELALRGTATDDPAHRLLALRFDGHKGTPLRFDPADHHLIQPLYVADASSRLLGEISLPEK